jgi:HK97 family phage major capsid protein
MPDMLTKEDITKAVSEAYATAKAADKAADEAKKKEEDAKKITRKFTPGAGLENTSEVTMTKDAADQPWGDVNPTTKQAGGFGEFLMAVKSAGSGGSPIREPRLKRCIPGALDPVTKAPTGAGESVPSDGAFLVAQEFIPNLINRTYNTSIVFNKCTKQPVGANFNGFKIPAIDETSRADGSRFGGIQAYWGAEAASITASKPKFRQISVELQKLFALAYVTDELLQDSVALEGYIMQWFPQEFGFKLDDAIINGDGAGKPLGILSSPGRVTVSKETGQVAATIVTNNILKMYRRCWAPSWKNAVWFINQNTLEQLFTLTIPIGTAGALANLFQFPTNAAGPFGAEGYGTMLSRPVIPIEQCASVGTEGDVIFADLSQYIVGDKGGLSSASSIHVAFVTDQTAFRFIYRVNGEPVWHQPLTPYKGTSDTLSPYVTLQTRS